MFIDYVALMLVNLSAGLVLLALFVFKFLEIDGRRMAPGFLITGFIAGVTGLYMIFTWPLPSSYNIAFGELYVMFGMAVFALGLALIYGWDLLSIAVFGVFAGLAAVVVGVRILQRGMTDSPPLAALGFVLTGLGAILSLPLYLARTSKALKAIVIIVVLAAAVVWAFIGFGAYWKHLESFAGWKPR